MRYFWRGRTSCGIDLGEFFIVTGGIDWLTPTRTVSKYSKSGWVEDLHSLMKARSSHACSQYKDERGGLVMLVTGGWSREAIDSTEISDDLGVSWRSVTSLPSRRKRIQAVPYNNKILIFGKSNF